MGIFKAVNRKIKLLKPGYWGICFLLLVFACSDDDPVTTMGPGGGNQDTTGMDPDPEPFDIDQISDTYGEIADPAFTSQWGPYNVHDPSVLNDGEYFYSYSTDVAFGASIRPGLQIRRSKDLVEWEFRGWVFATLPARGEAFIRSNGGEPFNGLWAPYIMKVGSEYRLYYSLSSPTPRLSVIGLATATDPEGPWREVELVVTSLDDNSIQTNAIDPSVLVDLNGDYWMYYGSAWDGIYLLKLDPATGLAATPGDKGIRVAQRGFTNGTINGNIEGPEIIYNPDYGKYYLFIAYDWLETKYNIRVGRADSPQGPFMDINGQDLNQAVDDAPMIVAPYAFEGHRGWQGTAHNAVFKDGNDYYIAHQGRPAENHFYMVMHVRQLFWTDEGWPLASPQRFAGIANEPVEEVEIPGNWERIKFNYRVVPGFSQEQTLPDIQRAEDIILDEAGTINSIGGNTWVYEAPDLTLNWEDGSTDNLIVHRGRDWENKIDTTLLFTGLTQEAVTVWGKKIP